ncbi:MAG: c-type cytochrome [Chloroflexi bacterium]|nr:c-type cytochrome [Chloroflexota bacterium]
MRKLLKWIAIVLGALLGIVIVAIAAVYLLTSLRLNKKYDVQVETVAVSAAPSVIAQGRHIVESRGCSDCHGEDLGGEAVIEDPMFGYLYGVNLTGGKGGHSGHMTDADYVRAIRHGVAPDGKPLVFMPAEEYYYLSDADLGAVISYLKTVPPVDREMPPIKIGPLLRLFFLLGQVDVLGAENIAHTAPRPVAPPPGVTVAYGEYLAVGCTGCHGKGYSGGRVPGTPPDWPPASNLTPSGNLARWTEADFLKTLRTGATPEGKQLDSNYMPWKNLGRMTDDELKAVWLYIKALPAKETGTR